MIFGGDPQLLHRNVNFIIKYHLIRFCLSNFRHSVVLGEHTKNQEMDCNIYNDKFGKEIERDCADPIEVFGIDKFIVHPDYNRPKYSNDIALIRLNRDVVMKGIVMGTFKVQFGPNQYFPLLQITFAPSVCQ